ncbi:DNA-binding transcriptional regulator, AcrR family [Asanoa hainanensis]|uniref:DNA-binding transcriptional regulator, AcrR family n=1 Tax=Asanoa hainanensis TaxID=560556 RepID=A0A239MTM5_9ACTN|nr:TetR/AcrR family transcriptional regulator [Asanoa hainanensis]SNT45603.1 DNA-binding transcriptional regulator, AcrR family [Asanoa hainanensis]
MTSTAATGGRARPLPPEERRAALVAATLPLVVKHGTKVTTKQIAEAAGVAEGTIFRVFPDKESLVREAIATVLDPLPTVAALNAIDLDLPVRERLGQAVDIIRKRLETAFAVMSALRMDGPQHHKPEERPSHQPMLDAIERVVAPDAHQFRMPAPEVARMLRLLTFAGTHRIITDNNPMTTEEVVSVLLDGVLRRPDSDSHQSNPGERC